MRYEIFKYTIRIGGEHNPSQGQFSSWDTLKLIEPRLTDYNDDGNTQWEKYIHYNRMLDDFPYNQYDDNGSGPIMKPKIKIEAIGTAQYDVVQRVVTYKDGQVLETLAGVCDGRSVTVSSGTYTLENVTAEQHATNSWADLTGSSISYKPPPGTRQVIYKYYCLATIHDGNHLLIILNVLLMVKNVLALDITSSCINMLTIMVFFIMFLTLVVRMK